MTTSKRGRKSAGDLAVVPLSAARLPPPENLTSGEVDVWKGIVDSLPASFFRPADVPLLAAYCTAYATHQKACIVLTAESLFLEDKAGRQYAHPAQAVMSNQASSMAQLSTKLRLAPSSRYDEKAAHTATKNASPAGKRLWEA